MENFVKCGEKEKHLFIPDGWYLLLGNQIVEKGDMVANILQFHWMNIDDDDVGIIATACGDYVIRKHKNFCVTCEKYYTGMAFALPNQQHLERNKKLCECENCYNKRNTNIYNIVKK